MTDKTKGYEEESEQKGKASEQCQEAYSSVLILAQLRNSR